MTDRFRLVFVLARVPWCSWRTGLGGYKSAPTACLQSCLRCLAIRSWP